VVAGTGAVPGEHEGGVGPMTGTVVLAAAFISAVLGPMLVIWRQNRHDLRLLRQENTDQHAEGRQMLQTIHNDLRVIHTDLGAVGERADQVAYAVDEVRVWVHEHEVRHAVEGMQRDEAV
jgi:hypothetical protein